MKITRKAGWVIAATAAGLLCVFVLVILGLLQSDWFRDEVRKRIITQVETATGGRVEIGHFDYDWRSMTADLEGFVIHGKETPPADPLLRIDDARITVRVISVLERVADISSVVLTRPQVNVIVMPDGSTNLPTPPAAKNSEDPLAELFRLKLKHFAISNGLAAVNDKRIPLNVKGEGVDITASYAKGGPSYEISTEAREMDFGFGDVLRGPLHFEGKASLKQNSVRFENVNLNDAETTVRTQGTLVNFAHPQLDFQLAAAAATNTVLPVVKFTEVRGGRLAVHGDGHYDEAGGWTFTGRAEAKQAEIQAPPVILKGVGATGDVDVRKSGIRVRHIIATARGAKFEGEATIEDYKRLAFEGNVSGLVLSDVASYVTKKPLAWSGVVNGRVRGKATLAAKANDLAVQADLGIAHGGAGIPVTGAVNLRYEEKSNALDFGDSHLTFPRSSIAFAGSLRGDNQVVFDSSDLDDVRPVFNLIGVTVTADEWPVLMTGGNAHFDGTIGNLTTAPKFSGQVAVSAVKVEGQTVDQLSGQFNVSGNGVDFSALDLRQGETRIGGTGLIGMSNWSVLPDSPVRAGLTLHAVDVEKVVGLFSKVQLPIIHGIASGTVQLHGTLNQPEGRAHISSDSLDAYGEQLNRVEFEAEMTGNELHVSKGRVVSNAAVLSFLGEYAHKPGDWLSGTVKAQVDTNGFPLGSLSPVKKYEPQLNARAELHFIVSAEVGPGKFVPTGASGTMQLADVTWNKVPYGDLTLNTATHSDMVSTVVTGDFRKNPLRGIANISLAPGNHTTAEINFDHVTLQSIYSLSGSETQPLLDGSIAAKLKFDGSLQQPEQMRVSLIGEKLMLSSHLKSELPERETEPEFTFHNAGPLEVGFYQGVVDVRHFRIEGDQTGLEIAGTMPIDGKKPMDFKVSGTVNLQAYHLFDPNVKSAGISSLTANVGGTWNQPNVNGTLEVKNGSFFPENLPNGLSEVNGTVSFTRNRATLQKMTAKSGGGELALSGFLSYAGGAPLVYHLEGSADNVRVRYAGSISVTASSRLRLSGTSTNSLLAGTLTISRISFNSNTDLGGVFSNLGAAAAAPANENDFLSGLHLDVAIESAPNLQLNTSLSRDVEAEINLRLRGSPQHPVVIGTLSANQGDIQVFGNRYTINRGEISFVNPVKIEPSLDLDLETRARGITVDITVSGTFSKLNIAYRSDPPLQPTEIIALLSLGRPPDSTDTGTTLRSNSTSTLQSPANSLLGAAVTSPVTNRLSKLFGITNIRIDPLVQGITNTPQTRVTLEQQISRDITITYVTNLSETSEQVFRFEWAFSPQFSVVALRDDNGEFGIDFQYKKQFK